MSSVVWASRNSCRGLTKYIPVKEIVDSGIGVHLFDGEGITDDVLRKTLKVFAPLRFKSCS
jgi:hypothetical protein